MKKWIPRACLAFVLLVPAGLKAQDSLIFDPATPLPSTISPGQSFTFTIQLSNPSDPDIVGYDYALQSVQSGSQTPVSGIFSLTGLTITDLALTSANSSPTLPAGLNPQVGTASQPTDLGATTPNGSPNAGDGAGTFNVESLTVKVNANATSGDYQLELYFPEETAGGEVAGPVQIIDDPSFSNVGPDAPLFSSVIDVSSGEGAVPEPSTWALLIVGGLLLFFRRSAVSFIWPSPKRR
jgi:hypothetical protein